MKTITTPPRFWKLFIPITRSNIRRHKLLYEASSLVKMSSYLKPIWGNLQNGGNLKLLPTSMILKCKALQKKVVSIEAFHTPKHPWTALLALEPAMTCFPSPAAQKTSDQHPYTSPTLSMFLLVWSSNRNLQGDCCKALGISGLPGAWHFSVSKLMDIHLIRRWLVWEVFVCHMPTHKVCRSLGGKT